MKKVVIIGGGFAGARCAKSLQENFDVTLIDNKEYFEFTPAILRVIVNPEHLEKIQVCHTNYFKGKFICGEVTEISEKSVKVKTPKKKLELDFDYLIISSGSKYASPIKDRDVVISTRGKNLKTKNKSLKKAKQILIIGAGLVGVELAAEIHSVYPEKKIKIIDRHEKLVRRMPQEVSKYLENLFSKESVELIFNDEIKSKKGKTAETIKGRKIYANLTFLCTGIKSNFEFMKKNFKEFLNSEDQIQVNEFLQISNSKKTFSNIFVGGDITSIKEEKTAQSAEDHAKIIIANLNKIERNSTQLVSYKPRAKIMVVGLGKRNGILIYKKLILTGIIPAILKRFIEWRTMIHYR